MTAREQLVAYVATLIAIVILVAIAAIVACLGHPVEALGVGAAVTGLIGLTRTPSTRTPVATTDSGDVNVSPAPAAAGQAGSAAPAA